VLETAPQGKRKGGQTGVWWQVAKKRRQSTKRKECLSEGRERRPAPCPRSARPFCKARLGGKKNVLPQKVRGGPVSACGLGGKKKREEGQRLYESNGKSNTWLKEGEDASRGRKRGLCSRPRVHTAPEKKRDSVISGKKRSGVRDQVQKMVRPTDNREAPRGRMQRKGLSSAGGGGCF